MGGGGEFNPALGDDVVLGLGEKRRQSDIDLPEGISTPCFAIDDTEGGVDLSTDRAKLLRRLPELTSRGDNVLDQERAAACNVGSLAEPTSAV
jgi:hypothetical protein